MNEQPNRTIVCSVLFLDIVGYSRRSVAEQMTLKQRFNALLDQVLRGVAASERIVLDTGDGAAVSFLGNPEDTLFAATSLRDAISAESASGPPVLATRIGINLGPVRLIKDLNRQLNIIGDGINVAQRVMGFSEPGQILVSRSYYEVVSRLSPEYSQLFRYQGARTDKHVREHEVYEVGPTSPDLKRSAEAASLAGTTAAAGAAAAAIATRIDRRLLVLLPLGAALVLAAGVAIRMQRPAPPAPAAPQPSALPAAPQPSERSGPAASARAPAKAASPVRAPQPAPRAKPAREAPEQPAVIAAPPSPSPSPPPVAAQRAAEPVAPPPPATLRLAIVPWGEVFVDGKSHGVSPPLRQLALSPGRHLIVVQNTTLPPHTEQVDLKPGEQLTIRHRFN